MTTQHNAHFTDYKVLSAEDPEVLSQQVMHAIRNRWQPYGDMSVAEANHGTDEPVILFQPIVKMSEWFL